MFSNNRFFFALLLLSVFVFNCERVEPALSDRAPAVAASEQATLKSRGYTMSVDTDHEFAKITTASSGEVPLPSDPMVIAGPSVAEISLSGETMQLENANGELANYHVVALPDDGRNYWAVPFNPNLPPVEVSGIIIILVGDCRCGSNTVACQNSGLGCVTGVCAVCSRDVIILRDMIQQPTNGDPYVLVAANSLEFNGVLFD